MKIKVIRKTFSFIILLLCAVAFIGCGPGTMETKKETNPEIQQAVSITEADKTIAVEIPSAQNHERGNASGPSIPSGAHSESFPGIVFVWDSKATNNGYLIVTSEVFDKYESFTLTTKEGSSYWDFIIKPETGQQKNKDGNYIFYILRVSGSNKINKVFVSEWIEKEDNSQTDEEKIAAVRNELTIPAETDRDMNLPSVLNGVTISWASSDEDLISSSTGRVARPRYDMDVELTATLTLGSVTATKEFTVKVFARSSGEPVEVEAELVTLWPATSVTASVLIIMTQLVENAVFICDVDKGVFIQNEEPEYAKNATVHSGSGVLLYNRERNDGVWVGPFIYEQTFVEIVVKLEQNIIGYIVIKAYGDIDKYDNPIRAVILKSVLFPQIGGKYQNISEEYVKTEIEKVKAQVKR